MRIKFSFLFLLLALSTFVSFGQTRKELENQRRKLNKEISKVNNLLFKKKKEKSNALDDLKDINQKINVRQRLIGNITSEITVISKEISSNEKKLNAYQKELDVLKKDYAAMVFESYKSKSNQSKTMFLLSSDSFYQAYKRIKYMQQYTDFRKKQADKILVQTDVIEQFNDSLSSKKLEKQVLINQEIEQKDFIEKDKKNQEGIISKIKKQESKYKKQLQQKVKKEKVIAQKIDKIIKEAIASANAKKKKTGSSKLVLNAEEKSLKANFEQNKGSLPWPVDGLVTRKFGVQPHPTFKGININSTGLHIRGKEGDAAKSIFNGKVLGIHLLSQGRKAVMVQHGDYITTYNNLRAVSVTKGDKVKTGQSLGKIFTDKVTGKTDLVFVVFKNTVRLNPSDWIKRK